MLSSINFIRLPLYSSYVPKFVKYRKLGLVKHVKNISFDQNSKICSEFWYAIYLTKGHQLVRSRYIKHFLNCCPLLARCSNWFKSGLAFTLIEVKHRNFCNSYLQLFWVSVLCILRHISIDGTQTLLYYYDAKEALQIVHACTIGCLFFWRRILIL